MAPQSLDELRDDLLAKFSREDCDVCCAAGSTNDAGVVDTGSLSVPPLALNIGKWAWERVVELGCERRSLIEAAVRAFLAARVPNALIAGMILSAMEALLDNVCPAAR